MTRALLLDAGFGSRQIERRLARGSLIRVHRGVYRVGHCAPSRESDYLAAVLACGDGAVLAGRAAAHLWELIRGVPHPEPEVIAPRRHTVGGVIARRGALDETDRTTHLGIRVTTPARTLVSLAAVCSAEQLGRAVHEAFVKYGTAPDDIEAALDRVPNAKGARVLRALTSGDKGITLSRLETRFLRLVRRARLPLPETNTETGSFLVDCRWPEHRLTVELDGYRFHASRHAWERDRAREREAYARGDQFRRYTWDDVTKRPETVLVDLKRLLSQSKGI